MSQNPGQMGNLSNLPSSSSWGLPTSWNFSQNGVPMGMLAFMIGIVLLLMALHIIKPRGGRRR